LSLPNMLGLCQAYMSYLYHDIENSSFYNNTSPLSVEALQWRSCLSYLTYATMAASWTVISLTAAKFQPLILSVWLRLALTRECSHSHDFV
jgi:hypothetical protein